MVTNIQKVGRFYRWE